MTAGKEDGGDGGRNAGKERTMSRITYTPLDLTTKEMSAAVIVIEYIAPLSMMTRRTGPRKSDERYCADRLVTVQIRPARRTIQTRKKGRA